VLWLDLEGQKLSKALISAKLDSSMSRRIFWEDTLTWVEIAALW